MEEQKKEDLPKPKPRKKTILSYIPYYDFVGELCQKFDSAFVALLMT
jgi:hypothetical protein